MPGAGSGQPCYLDIVLKVDVLVPEFEFALEKGNEKQVLKELGERIAVLVQKRAQRGIGARGPLPKPKAGGTAYNATGTLTASIRAVQSRKGRVTVRATGKRDKAEVGKKAKRARAKTKALRAAKLDDFLRSDPVRAAELGAKGVRRELKLSKTRVRTATTNAALVGILSVAPKDKRAINGGRGDYRVMEPNNAIRQLGRDTAAKHIKPVLKGK